MKMLIAGDLVPTRENIDLFSEGYVEHLLGKELLALWNGVDYRSFNLECAVTDAAERLLKYGPALVVPAETLRGIRAMNPSVLFLANNHIMDAGPKALAEFLDTLTAAGIPWIGAGKDAASADNHVILGEGEDRVALYACCEHEFTVAGENSPGANAVSDRTCDRIRRLSNEAEHVVVIFHGGKEYYRYPSPLLQRRCREFVDAGAGLVLCQHSHCIGAEEKYKDGTILYGQGNFLFNKKRDEFWRTALVTRIDTDKGFSVQYLPVVQTEAGTRLANPEEAERILREMEERSKRIMDPEFVQRQYAEFSDSLVLSYLYVFAGWNPYMAALDRKLFHGWLIRRHYPKNKLVAILNYLTCEAHVEAAAEGIKNLINI